MQEALEVYESHLRLMPEVCADPWFGEQLALSRVGDEQARREISGSCPRLVLEIAKRRWRPDCQLSLLEFVEEGNVVLMKTVRRFSGETAAEFLVQLTQNVESAYTLILQRPGWGRERQDPATMEEDDNE
jgi:DNA-directed RNA polymerase sigma subunit (sigma70/sigma32)